MPGEAKRNRRLLHTVSSDEAGTRLDLLVGSWLADALARPLSKSDVRRLIMAGAIRLHGRPIRRAGFVVETDLRLEAQIDVARLRDRSPAATEVPPSILYEDDDVIAVAKPAGTVMHATADETRPNLFDTVRRLLGDRRPASGRPQATPYLGLHHRLDVETSGVVLFTKRESANRALARQFANGEVTKIYRAIAARPGDPPARAWRVDNLLTPAGTGRRARMREATEGTRAVTDFELLEALGDDALLVEARPRTGRKHQIRAHLADSLAPILGDVRYGGPVRAGRCPVPRVMLHAWRLSLRHPVTAAPLTITCPYPPDFAQLAACLRRSG